MFVFVYGTLMEGARANDVIISCGATQIIPSFVTLPKFNMFDLGPYPALTPGGYHIRGEIWAVPHASVEGMDHYEGHPDLFRRMKTNIGWVTPVEVYMYAPYCDFGRWKVDLGISELPEQVSVRNEPMVKYQDKGVKYWCEGEEL